MRRSAPLQVTPAVKFLDRLRLGTASGSRLITLVDSDVPGSKVVLHGPHGSPSRPVRSESARRSSPDHCDVQSESASQTARAARPAQQWY